ncbi:MAG: hypothetical protein IKH98_07275 [Candidatus Methanomethylophilaceae archaeon]|nr:hypothetical protein [Candidatus Methanomethylophilaceae archaeon]
MDTVIYLDRFASPGETVQATGEIVSCGGKGANRAVAAARAGAETTFVTALGEDREGRMLEERLAKEGVSLTVAWKRGDTGQAFIEVDGRSENRIAGMHLLDDPSGVLAPEPVRVEEAEEYRMEVRGELTGPGSASRGGRPGSRPSPPSRRGPPVPHVPAEDPPGLRPPGSRRRAPHLEDGAGFRG